MNLLFVIFFTFVWAGPIYAQYVTIEGELKRVEAPKLVPRGPFPNVEFVFKQQGVMVAKMTLEQMASRVAPMELTVLDPTTGKNEVYRGLPLDALFYAIYDQAWRRPNLEVALMRTDGTEALVPAAKVLKYASYLAYEHRGSDSFTVQGPKEDDKPIPVGPFYLIWDNLRETTMKELGASDWYPHIVSVNLRDYVEPYPQMIPPPNSSAEVKRGYAAFVKTCASCHTINGDGGANTGEMNYPTSVTEYLADKWIVKWTTDPGSIRLKPQMPPVPTKSINDIISYLKVMAKHKQKPR